MKRVVIKTTMMQEGLHSQRNSRHWSKATGMPALGGEAEGVWRRALGKAQDSLLSTPPFLRTEEKEGSCQLFSGASSECLFLPAVVVQAVPSHGGCPLSMPDRKKYSSRAFSNISSFINLC